MIGDHRGAVLGNKYYPQIDTIRFITICFIVFGHCLLSQWDEKQFLTPEKEYLHIFVSQTGKISTVIFFIIAGFLLRPKLHHYTLKSYLQDRIPKVYFPWVLFIIIFLIVEIVQELPLKEIFATGNIKLLLDGCYKILNGLLLYTAYWFITTYFVSMILFVTFRKYAESLFFGLILGLITCFYAVNLYYQWIAANHAKSILAYAFFVWIGILLQKHFDTVMNFIKRISWVLFIVVLVVMFYLSCAEGAYLQKIGCVDPFASNRVSNSLFSIVFLLALFKMGRLQLINNLNPRKTVYGIFLIHNLVIYELMIVLRYYRVFDSVANYWYLLIIQILFCSIIVFITYIIVSILVRSKYSWLIGVKHQMNID
ncbi:MAG: acyltransferase [Pelobium sp.]